MEINTWPISERYSGELCLIGIPQRLGDGAPYTKNSYGSFPSLEEKVGEHWEKAILTTLLEKERPLVWWTTRETFKRSGLYRHPATALPDEVSLSELASVLCVRHFRFRGRVLAMVSASADKLRKRVIDWSDADTEVYPELLITSPDAERWNISAIEDWCKARQGWSNPESIVPSFAQRIILLYDGDIYCALRRRDAGAVLSDIANLSRSWGLSVIAGPDAYCWIDQS